MDNQCYECTPQSQVQEADITEQNVVAEADLVSEKESTGKHTVLFLTL